MSNLTDDLLFQIRAVGLPEPKAEYRFHPERRFRFDFCWPRRKLALEVEGGTWSSVNLSRHTTPQGYARDCQKYSEAAVLGFKIIRVTADMVRSGEAVRFVERALKREGK